MAPAAQRGHGYLIFCRKMGYIEPRSELITFFENYESIYVLFIKTDKEGHLDHLNKLLPPVASGKTDSGASYEKAPRDPGGKASRNGRGEPEGLKSSRFKKRGGVFALYE